MTSDEEWMHLAQKVFPKRQEKAPPFLWTRILSGIEAEEHRRASLWWMQLSWMSRVAITVSLLVGLGSFYLFRHAVLPLDVALDGRSDQQQAIRIATADM